jgi:hypothetical protein
MTPSTSTWENRRMSRRTLLRQAALGAAVLTPLSWLVPREAVGLSAQLLRPTLAAGYDAAVPTAWFDLMLRLIRHTPGFSPPVASRALGGAGLALYEAVLPGLPDHVSLAGTIKDLPRLPAYGRNGAYHWPSVANAALAAMARGLFPTAPPELRAEVDALETRLVAPGAPPGIATRSVDRGRAVAAAIGEWATGDGGHDGHLRNFPADYVPPTGPGLWVPTPPAFLPALQPRWGTNRCMLLASADDCPPGAPPEYSTAPDSPFHAEAVEVYDTVNALTPEQEAIARFWADDPGETATPPGHSISILTQLVRAKDRSLADAAVAYAKLGIAICDAFIACWRAKYVYNLLRPITYVRANIDPAWGDPLPLTTPPFPEYPSGHSVQSAAAAEVLTDLFGAIPFTDHTHDARGLPPRSFASFDDFAAEAAISRLYGGIHFRSAIERGLEQGRCIGSTVARVPMAR